MKKLFIIFIFLSLFFFLQVKETKAAQPVGFLDVANETYIAGWAKDDDYNGPIPVHIYVDGQIVQGVTAGNYRSDLQSAGVCPGGNCAFQWNHPSFGPGNHTVNVYAIGVNSSGQPDNNNPELSNSPKIFTTTGPTSTPVPIGSVSWLISIPSTFPKFFTSDNDTNILLNDFFFRHYSAMVGPNAYTQPMTENRDWDSLSSVWIDTNTNKMPNNGGYNIVNSSCGNPAPCTLQLDYNKELKDDLLNVHMDPDGYVWTDFQGSRIWGTSGTRGWPADPECRTDQQAATTDCRDSRRTNNNTSFVLASNRYFQWTGDIDFLRQNIFRIRQAIHFLQTVTNGDGLGRLRITFKNSGGRDAALADRGNKDLADQSNDWNDILPFGWEDAHATIYYYGALVAMADLEKTIEDHPEWNVNSNQFGDNSYNFLAKAAIVKQIAGNYFWNSWWDGIDPNTKDFTKGRFIGTVDKNGAIHDYGFVDINLQSVFYGLANTSQSRAIYDWIAGTGTNEFLLDTSRGADIYKFEFAPRITTKNNTTWYSYGYGVGNYWEDYIENGGAALYNSFYDIYTRLKTAGPDDAYNRFGTILSWYKRTQDAGGYWEYYNYTNHPERGKMAGCPQSGGNPLAGNGILGLVCEFTEVNPALSFLYGFLGVEAKPDGLHVNPKLPSNLDFAGVERLFYQGKYLKITARKSGQTGIHFISNNSMEVDVLNNQEFIIPQYVSVSPTPTTIPPTSTPIPPTDTPTPPSPAPIPPTDTPIPPSPTNTPPSPTSIPPSPTPTPIPGDITGKDGVPDGKVDIYDYNKLIGDFGKTNSPADIDKNGKVDIYDYNTLIGNFGKKQ